MSKALKVKRNAKSGRFTLKVMGVKKATKFSAVEGQFAGKRLAQKLAQWDSEGLTGDALRAAIVGEYSGKRM